MCEMLDLPLEPDLEWQGQTELAWKSRVQLKLKKASMMKLGLLENLLDFVDDWMAMCLGLWSLLILM